MSAGSWKPLNGITFYPDFHYLGGQRVILDAKYKRSENRSLEDVRQVFAYMFLTEARHGGLIKPAEFEEGGDRECEPVQMPHLQNADSGRRWWDLSLCVGTGPGEDALKYGARMKAAEEAFRERIKKCLLEGEIVEATGTGGESLSAGARDGGVTTPTQFALQIPDWTAIFR